MYENVSKKDKNSRRDFPLAAAIAIFLVVAVIAGLPIYRTFEYRHEFNVFTDNLKTSIIHGKHFYCNISVEAQDKLYGLICSAGPGKIITELPDGESFMVDFGDGSSILFIKTEIHDESSANDYGTVVAYTARDGSFYAYDTDKLNYGILIRYITT